MPFLLKIPTNLPTHLLFHAAGLTAKKIESVEIYIEINLSEARERTTSMKFLRLLAFSQMKGILLPPQEITCILHRSYLTKLFIPTGACSSSVVMFLLLTFYVPYSSLCLLLSGLSQATAIRTRLRSQGGCKSFWRCEKRVR